MSKEDEVLHLKISELEKRVADLEWLYERRKRLVYDQIEYNEFLRWKLDKIKEKYGEG